MCVCVSCRLDGEADGPDGRRDAQDGGVASKDGHGVSNEDTGSGGAGAGEGMALARLEEGEGGNEKQVGLTQGDSCCGETAMLQTQV